MTTRIAEFTASVFGGNDSAFVLREENPDGTKFVGRVDVPKSTGNPDKDSELALRINSQISHWKETGVVPEGPFAAI